MQQGGKQRRGGMAALVAGIEGLGDVIDAAGTAAGAVAAIRGA